MGNRLRREFHSKARFGFEFKAVYSWTVQLPLNINRFLAFYQNKLKPSIDHCSVSI
jgi:hypothetical protein